MSNEDEPAEPFGAAYLASWRNRRLKDAKSSYNQILNRLWAGSGAGVAANLALICGLVENGHAPSKWDFIPLFLFVIGLTFLGVGAATSLVVESRVIRDMEEAESILDLKIDHFKRPSDFLTNWQTKTAIGSASALTGGVIIGFALLFCGLY